MAAGVEGVRTEAGVKRALAVSLLFALLSFLMRVPFLRVPFSSDEGYQSLVARQWLSGHSLYGDLAFVRPPLLALPYAAARLITGNDGDITLRLMAALWSAATVALLAYFLLRRLRLMPALAGAALMTAWSASISLQNEANAETWLLLPWTAGGLLLLHLAEEPPRGARAMWALAGAGALVGVAALFKQPAAVGALLPLAAVAAFSRPWRDDLRAALAFIAGFGAALAGSLFACALAGDGIAYLFRAWVGMFAYVSAERSRTVLDALAGAWRSARLAYFLPAAAALGTAGVAWPFGSGRSGRAAGYVRFSAVWFAISLVGVSLSGYYFRHYFIQTIPALALLAAAGLQLAQDRGGWRRWVAAGLVVAAILSGAVAFVQDLQGRPRFVSDRAVSVTIAHRIDSHTPPGGRFVVWGAYQAAAAYSAREPASRMSWFWLSGFDPPVTTRFLGKEFPSKGSLALEDLRAGTVDTFAITTPLVGEDPRDVDDPRVAEEIQRMLDADYVTAARGRIRSNIWVIYSRED